MLLMPPTTTLVLVLQYHFALILYQFANQLQQGNGAINHTNIQQISIVEESTKKKTRHYADIHYPDEIERTIAETCYPEWRRASRPDRLVVSSQDRKGT
jgi:hypothetical protein